MDVACDKCHSKIKIPDKKLQGIPKGQTIGISCPKCKHKITVDPGGKKPPAGKPPAAKPTSAKPESKNGKESGPTKKDAGSKNNDPAAMGDPFDWLEEGAITAMICEPDPNNAKKIKSFLTSMGYHIAEPQMPRDALKQMRGHDFDFIALNENFGTPNPDANHVLKYLDQLMMNVRRNIFVALFTNRFKTMDNMMTFNKSVNLIINLEDIDNMDKILERGINENKSFFKVYKELQKKVIG